MAVNNDPKFDFAKYVRDHPELREKIFSHHWKASSFFGDGVHFYTAEEMKRRADEQRPYHWQQYPPNPDTTIRDEAYRGKVLTDVTYRRA